MKKVLIYPNLKILTYDNYVKACLAVGLEPTLSESIVDPQLYDALLLPGGVDVDPSFYGEENKGSLNLDYEADKNELELIDAFFKAKKPIMGVCRGMQILNVYFGGSLIQHIDKHKLDDGGLHEIVFLQDNKWGKKFKEKGLLVNSTHHQCVDRLGKDLVLFAKASDGTPEAYYHKEYPAFGVQWHPEKILDRDQDGDTGLYVYKEFAKMFK